MTQEANEFQDRRQYSDRIVRLETVVERIEDDVVGLLSVYKTMGQQQQEMFVQAIKSSAALQSSIDTLNLTVANFMQRFLTVEKTVDEHSQFKWKLIGMATGVTIAINTVVWLIGKL